MTVMLTHQQQTDVLVKFSVGASDAAGTVIKGDIYQFGYANGSVTLATIPATEVWHLIAMKVNGSSVSTDAQVEYYQNGYKQDFEPYLSSLLTQNNFSPYTFDESQVMYPTNQFNVSIILSDAAPSSAYTQSMVLRFQRAPYLG